MSNPIAVPIAGTAIPGLAVRVHAKGPTALYFDAGDSVGLTVQFEYSADGINWTAAGAPFVAVSGFRIVTDELVFVRADTTAITSIGTAKARVVPRG